MKKKRLKTLLFKILIMCKETKEEETINSFCANGWIPYVPELAPTQEKPKGVVENVKELVKQFLKR